MPVDEQPQKTVHPLPPHLVLFVRQAAMDSLRNQPLRLENGMVSQPNMYVRSWALAYLTCDQVESLRRLEAVHAAYQQAHIPAPEVAA